MNSNLLHVTTNVFQDIYNLLKYYNFLHLVNLPAVSIKKLSIIINCLIDNLSGYDN